VIEGEGEEDDTKRTAHEHVTPDLSHDEPSIQVTVQPLTGPHAGSDGVIDRSERRVDDEEEEELVVVAPNTVGNPRAVMVHPHHALVADATVMSSLRLVSLTNLTEP